MIVKLFPTVEIGFLSWCRRNRCRIRRWQLASCRRLLQIVCKLGASYGVKWDRNHWASCYQQDLWLVTALQLGGYEAPSL